MQIEADKARLEARKIQRDMNWEVWRLVLQMLAALGAAAGGGAAVLAIILHLMGKI